MNIQFPHLAVADPDDSKSAILQIVQIVNTVLRLLGAALLRVPLADIRSITSSTTADAPFIVPHSLMTIPKFASALCDSAEIVYANSDDKREWSATQIKLRCTGSGSTLIVKIEA